METIKEIFSGRYGDVYGNSSTDRQILDRYDISPCVIAYYKNCLGICFIIKGKTKYFAFKGKSYDKSNGYLITRINIKDAIKLIENPQESRFILKSRVEKMKDTFVFEELEK